MTDSDVRGGTESATEAVKYETRSAQTVRGTEKLMISKWEKDGWELVTQNTGKLRTELVFRRPKPPFPWKPLAIIGGVLVVLGIFIAIMVAVTGGDENDAPAPADTSSSEAVAPRDEPSEEPEEPIATAPAEEAPLTVENNADLAALLTGPQDGPTVEAFAQQYAGQLIEFDGSIGAMNNHEGYTTRYDILISYGDYSETHSNGGPSFQFRDVNITNDLHFMGDVPDTIGVGTNVHVIARVGSFKEPLFQLEPVETRVR
ncbi:DUF4839 domain-containing protein [Microbacterium esteraromaticum]|uniref:DUF4839 domain-containing protein n=1 Tax=Microbacterium esteraromaticum TaxID=57043 RepID=UPI0023685143|nr:DUF4839 domain-containing protein [Microbacterium esteraromaticum]WDH78197.1 DUF4839 domain-containing protein [Microbacterium esteraromaticum]